MTDFCYEIMGKHTGASTQCDECSAACSTWYVIMDNETGKRRWLCQECWDKIKWEAK